MLAHLSALLWVPLSVRWMAQLWEQLWERRSALLSEPASGHTSPQEPASEQRLALQ